MILQSMPSKFCGSETHHSSGGVLFFISSQKHQGAVKILFVANSYLSKSNVD
jgi:hypothetical protein